MDTSISNKQQKYEDIWKKRKYKESTRKEKEEREKKWGGKGYCELFCYFGLLYWGWEDPAEMV